MAAQVYQSVQTIRAFGCVRGLAFADGGEAGLEERGNRGSIQSACYVDGGWKLFILGDKFIRINTLPICDMDGIADIGCNWTRVHD